MNKLIYGIHAVQSVLDLNPKRFIVVYIYNKSYSYRLQLLTKSLYDAGITVQLSSRQFLNKKVGLTKHQGIVAEVYEKDILCESDLLSLLINEPIPLLLVLDNITDPHNLGACLRCADAAGVHMVIVPRSRSPSLNHIVSKISSGASEVVPLIRVANLARTLKILKKYYIYIVGTDIKSDKKIYNVKLTGRLALIMGSEEKGIRHLTKKFCDELVTIPMFGLVSSLNVSVATGICLFEAIRQRSFSF